MSRTVRSIIAAMFFAGAIIALGVIPMNDNFLPVFETYVERSDTLQLLMLAVMCAIGGFVVLLLRPSKH